MRYARILACACAFLILVISSGCRSGSRGFQKTVQESKKPLQQSPNHSIGGDGSGGGVGGAARLAAVGRWASYSNDENRQGACGQFADITPEPTQWIVASEKLLVEIFGFVGCTNDPSGIKPPQCWQIKNAAGRSLCGTQLQVRCEDRGSKALCKSSEWFDVVIVDVCSQNAADSGPKGETACRDQFVIAMDRTLQGRMVQRDEGPELSLRISGDFSAQTTQTGGDHPSPEQPEVLAAGSPGCDYKDAAKYEGYGYNSELGKSCAPQTSAGGNDGNDEVLPSDTPGCDYKDAGKYDGYGWHPEKQKSCRPRAS